MGAANPQDCKGLQMPGGGMDFRSERRAVPATTSIVQVVDIKKNK
jgi:hypothetical protein